MRNPSYLFPSLISLVIILQACEKKTDKEILQETKIERPKDSSNLITTPTEKLEKDISYDFTVEKIDSLEYRSIKKKTAPIKKNLVKITDISKAKKLLKGIVEFDENPDFGGNPAVKKIHFRNGKTYGNDKEFDYYFFIAYYPEEDILLCEGGHSTDISFNLKNGKQTEETGNPDLLNFSTNEIFRINGSYDGQECLGYFIQKKINGEFVKIIDLEKEFEAKTSIMLCNIRDGFWIDDHTFYLEKYDFDYETGKYKFFKINIIEK